MDGLLFRTRVAVLWVALTVASMGSWLLILFEAGRLEELLAGTMEGEPLDDTVRFTFTAMVVLPLVMAGVTLLLSDRVNRWVNVLAGLALGLFGVYGVGSALVAGELHWHVWPTALATAFAFLIAGLGVVGLRQPSSPDVADAAAHTQYPLRAASAACGAHGLGHPAIDRRRRILVAGGDDARPVDHGRL